MRHHVVLHFGIGIVDDGQEHVQQDKEDEEDVGEKEDRAENAMGVENGVKIEIAENDAEERETEKAQRRSFDSRRTVHSHRRAERFVIRDHCSEEEITQLGVGQEDDHKHDAEPENVFGTTR